MTTTDEDVHAVSPDGALPLLQFWKDEDHSSSWVADFRRRGYARYRALGGLPTPKIETWKYTDLARFKLPLYQPSLVEEGKIEVGENILSSLSWPLTEGLLTIPGSQLILVNGHFTPKLSSAALPDGLIVQSLKDSLRYDKDLKDRLLSPEKAQPMAALNAAWLEDGLVLRFKKNFAKDNIVHIVCVSTKNSSQSPIVIHPYIVVIVEGNAILIESHIGLSTVLTNMVSSLHIEPHATLTHVRAQSGVSDAHIICSSTAHVGSRGLYQGFVLTTGLGLVRNELTVTLAEREAACRLSGAYTADSDRHVDNTIVIDHVATATKSRQTFKGVLDNGGRGVFQGRISIHPQAQKSDGYQTHRALLLSPGAEVDCKPELEISADDVKCTHGATAGELDEETLFYLRTRGLNSETARALLIKAFLSDVVDEMSLGVPKLSNATMAMVAVWLADRTFQT